jgi:hypothetical protein
LKPEIRRNRYAESVDAAPPLWWPGGRRLAAQCTYEPFVRAGFYHQVKRKTGIEFEPGPLTFTGDWPA